MFVLLMVEMSLIYILNNTGPKIDPCGTPVLIYFKPDSLTLFLTYCFETALLSVYNDSVTFDTNDHDNLFCILEKYWW